MMMQQNTISVFLSYALEDEPLWKELEAHLSLLQHQGLLSIWHNRQIQPGANWADVIDEQLEKASIILLLISAHFLASDYCYGFEMHQALQRHKIRQTRVIPIIVRPCDWSSAPFRHFQVLPTNARPITKWLDRDEAWTNVATGIRHTIENPLQSIDFPRTILPTTWNIPSIWNIPYRRNLFFVGREDQLRQLRTRLQENQMMALTQPLAINGLGGIGKTQLAIEYAYLYREDYQIVLWTRAETHEDLVPGYITIARLLNIFEQDAPDRNMTVQAVVQWLATHTGWLLILDNADDLSLISSFVPTSFEGHILLTTRAQAMGRLAGYIEVGSMLQDDGALFLLRRASLLTPNTSLEHAKDTDIAMAKTICEELGGLPLAIDQAGAYIEETQCGLSGYQQLYRTRRSLLLKHRGGLVADHPESVATTWSLAFEKVEQANPTATEILQLCAFLDPDAIPEEIFVKGLSESSILPKPVVADEFELNTVIRELLKFSLIRRDPVQKLLTIHRLVQAVLRDRMDKSTQRQWAERAMQTVYANKAVWIQKQHGLAQIQACAALIKEYEFASLETELSLALLSLEMYTYAHSNRERNSLILNLVILKGYSHAEAAIAAGCSAPVVGYIVREAQRFARSAMGK